MAVGTNHAQPSHQRSGSWHVEQSALSAPSSSLSSDFSLKFSNSAFMDGNSTIDSSQLWKSTPRDEEEAAAMRSTPGVVFQGHQRPSTVMGKVVENNQQDSSGLEQSSDGDQFTMLASGLQTWKAGDSQVLTELRSGQNVADFSLDKTITPGGVAEELTTQTASPWDVDRMSSLPWPVGADDMQDSVLGQNPFDTEDSGDQQPWAFGNGAVIRENPFSGESKNAVSWMTPDFAFEAQGDAAAIIAADEESFNREHELEIPSQVQSNDTTKQHDWTIPDSQFITRPSLLRVVGVNDPSDIGEVRISFGAFLAAGSGELGSLSRTSPDRPRPHFGDDKPILTPSPQPPVRIISNPTTPLDPVMQENSPDGILNRTSADGGIKKVLQQQSKSSDEVAQRWQMQEQSTKMEQSEQSRSIDASSTHTPGTVPQDVLSFEMEKLKLDEQFKTDASVKSRSRSTSQTSSQSSSSKGSVKSVIKKTNSQSAQSSRNVNGGKGSKPRERKHSQRQEKKERQNTMRKPLDVSSGLELKTDHELEAHYMHPSRMSFLTRSSLGDATSAERMTQFIAKAINEDPEELRKKLAAVEKQKVKVKLKKKQLSSSEVKATSPNARTSHFYPLASSSPQTKSSPEKIVYSPRRFQGIEQNNSHISPEKLSSYTMEDSVFASQDSPSMVPLSLKELDSKDFPLERESMPSSETGIFKHVIPQFGETYTVHKAKKEAEEEQSVPIIDPRKNRTHEIEQRLNRSLPQSIDPFVGYDRNFSHSPMSTGQFHTLTQEMNTMRSDSSPRIQRLDTIDSAVGSMTSVQSQDMTNSRHSWPEATPSNQPKQKEFHRADHARDNHQSGSPTTVEGPMGHSALAGDLKVAVQTGNLMHEQQTTRLVNQHYPPVGLPLSMAQGIVPLGNPETVSQLYPPDGSSGLSGTIGPILTGHGLNVQTHGTLSYTAPAAYGSRMVPLGSAMYPAQGHGTMNTFYGHVPFVQTVSATMGPKPSSLTPTYVQSLNVNIPPNIPGQQAPLHLQANGSSLSGFPASFTQPRAPESIPFHQHPSQHIRNGLLQVRPDFSPEVALPSPTQVIIPGEIKLPPFCCVGVLTETVIPLHNSSSRWMHCEIHSMLCTVNGVQVPSSASVFSHQPKVIIAPHTTENIKISIEPNEAGTFTTQLQVYSVPVVCEVQPMMHSLGPLLALNVVAEEPKVEVVLEDDNTIHFGEVSCGAKQCRPIHLINRGRAQVPIRIILSANSSSLHCFAFADADFSPKTDVLRGSAPAGAKGAALTIHTLSLKGRKDLTTAVEPTVVWLLFQSQKVGLNSTSSAGSPEEYTARLDVEIDSARQGPTISSIALKALEGIVRLHTPHKLQVLTLKSSLGKIASCTIPVKNAGNITAKVKLKIEGDSKQFSVKPIQLHLKPNEESEVQVMFQPTEANKQVESLVVLTVPNGPVYELVVKGSALPKDDDKFSLFSSKQVLCWSGVALGRSQQQKVILKTSSTSPVKLQLLIEGSHSDFQIQPMFSSHGRSPEHPQATLQPKKALPVHVSFSPSSMGLISSSLVIKSLTGNTKSMIPLYGCGGTSQLVLVDIRQLSEGYVINVGEVSLGKKNSVKVMVRNSGTRAAFVKAVCYSDIHTLKQYPSSHLRVHPDNFVLSERTSKAVLIEYQPLEKDAINCRTSVNSVAVLAFYTGDEFLRRQYKKYLQTGPWQPPSESMERSLLAGIDFTTTFQDEDKLVEDVKYPKVASWDSFFQSSVSRVLLTLVGSPPGPSDPNRSVDIVPVSDKGNPEAESWTAIPDFLTLSPCNSKDDKSGKGSEQLQIVNFSDRSLGFEFTWPAHSIVITPERGEIPPRSQGRVLVSAKPNLSGSSTQLPWGGTIYLKCDGRQQSIRVQIREEQVLESSPYQSSVLSFQSIPTTVGGISPLPTNHLPPLRIKNNDIVFEKTLTGTVTTSEILLTNTASTELTWNLSSVAPAYVKVDDSGNICRTTYLAFNVAKREGTIEAGRTMQIVVKFQPRDVGEYEQSWDLMTTSSSSKSKQKIFLHGQAVDRIGQFEQKTEDANLFQPSKSKKVTIKEPLRLSKSQKKGLYVTENVLNFPVTAPGATSVAKLQISNYSPGESPYSVRISPPIKPFSVQSRKFSVRPNRYVRFPVSFSPTEAGKYFEASLVITADPDIILTVQLQGSSAE